MTTRTITLDDEHWQCIAKALENHNDQGPSITGWQSPELMATVAAFDAAIAQPETKGPPLITLPALFNPGYEPGDGSAEGGQLVDGEWWNPLMGCDSLQIVVDNARAALAQPVGQGPTDEELNTLWNRCGTADEYLNHEGDIFEYARAVLARWGRPDLQPGPATGPKPHGYAYRYPAPWGGTVLVFIGGQDFNGSRPIEAIPYWLGEPPVRPIPQPIPVSTNA